VLGFGGALVAGQRLAPNTAYYAMAALAGSILGTAIGSRWMTERTTQYVLATIMLFAGLRLLVGSPH
jgi:uncharacterized membrane protein YfcA